MRRFLYRTLCFLSPLLLMAVVGEFYVRSIPNSYRLKDEWMNRHADSVEVLILGNSHAYYGIRPQELQGVAFNLSNVSQTAFYDYALLQHYLPQDRLRQVILVADNSSLFDVPLEQSEPYRCAYYTIYMGAGPHHRWSRYGLEIMQFDGFCEKLKAYHNGNYAMCDAWGWGTDYKASLSTFDATDTAAVQRLLQRHTCKDWQWAKYNARMVEETARYCQQQHIPLAVVQTPVCDAYNDGIPERQRKAIRQLMHKLRNTYGATLLDYSSDPRFSGRDFYDTDHLSDAGALKFTKILQKDLSSAHLSNRKP